jgi:hypothetical protein
VTGLGDVTSSALLDIFPPLRRFPSWVFPVKKYAQYLHREEKSLYMDYWLGAKKALKDGKEMVGVFYLIVLVEKCISPNDIRFASLPS